MIVVIISVTYRDKKPTHTEIKTVKFTTRQVIRAKKQAQTHSNRIQCMYGLLCSTRIVLVCVMNDAIGTKTGLVTQFSVSQNHKNDDHTHPNREL